MKNPIAFFILIAHMNFAMFIPHIDEVDIFDNSGHQVDDINCLNEYIDLVVLGHKDHRSQDEDDDNAVYFHLAKTVEYAFQQQVIELKAPSSNFKKKTKYPNYLEQKIISPWFDVKLPPPKI